MQSVALRDWFLARVITFLSIAFVPGVVSVQISRFSAAEQHSAGLIFRFSTHLVVNFWVVITFCLI